MFRASILSGLALAVCLASCTNAQVFPAQAVRAPALVRRPLTDTLPLHHVVLDTYWPNQMIVARDGSTWYSVFRHAAIVRIGSNGKLHEWTVKLPNTVVQFLAEGLNGSIWFEYLGDGIHQSCRSGIGRIVKGVITLFKKPCVISPGGIAVGRDGRLYVVDQAAGTVDAYNARGWVASYPVPPKHGWSSPDYMTAGPDGNLWISSDHFIVRMDLQGHTAAFRVAQDGDPAPFIPHEITAGADGNVWFNAVQANGNGLAVERITPKGHITRFLIDAPTVPFGLAAGPQRSVWFIDSAAPNTVGAVSPTGKVTLYTATGPDYPLALWAIATSANGALEFGGELDKPKQREFFVASAN
ncbi:MAG TPA: hypothetical protein VJP76_01225 [Candidatus Tumulicola sp.]|nr:hypothetical protein [Candidatus Tumulicola sp.]